MNAAKVRITFLDFFRSKGHEIVPSAPIVVKDDPTLLFTNAGMNQFKDFFLGNKTPAYKRVADTQKCLRVSGKHNDLEEVGVDTYHHTMFEMLGNWSFGDYFKKEAIEWSWQLLTEIYKIDKERLYVTVFGGDQEDGLPYDEEAFNEWKKHIDEKRILKGDKKDNFWEMGESGPCGPCSEIHIDCRTDEERSKTDGSLLVNQDHPQVIEIWNNVFMEFNRKKDGSLHPLPSKHVDTGMGFERLVRVLQGKKSNYDTDIFSGTINLIASITNKEYNNGEDKESIAFRVLADHIRAIAFTIADGQMPSNTGAGYVIRRILRRAVRYYYSYLDYKEPLLHQLLPHIADQFKAPFPEIALQQDFISKVIKEEEEAFLRTLEKGLKRIDEIITKASERKIIVGSYAFELYDTYGFPLDLTKLIAEEKGYKVDEEGFGKEMQQQKTRSRKATAIDTEDWIILNDLQEVKFVGYQDLNIETSVLRYRKVNSKGKSFFQIVLETTPFYAESGGQIGDTGVLVFGDEVIDVIDTKKENNLIIHYTPILPHNIEGKVIAKVNWDKRMLTSYNHTATHLMHEALKRVLGNHVSQKGSLVSNKLLRFDFSHFSKMTEEEIRKVELIVNEKIRENIPVIIKNMSKEEALSIGATALFGEKYGDNVRVVIIDPEYSIELCGGTHVGSTGMIGVFTIESESSVASGIRRIEAITGPAAVNYYAQKVSESKRITEILRSNNPLKAIEKLIDDNTDLHKRIEKLEAKQLISLKKELISKLEIIRMDTAHEKLEVSFIGEVVESSNLDNLKKICFDFKNNFKDYLIILCANIEGKAAVAVSISESLVHLGIEANSIIKSTVAPLIKGGGGGQKNLATAGGQDVSQFEKIINETKGLLLN